MKIPLQRLEPVDLVAEHPRQRRGADEVGAASVRRLACARTGVYQSRHCADVSRERVRYRGQGYGASEPVESPNGSTDAFYIKIDKHYGASDHVTYMQHGIPAVMFITWPDMWYHSSQDTPDKQDPTQYKRAAAVGTGALAALASGTDEMAARILSENIGRGLARMGESHTKGLGYLADATDAATLTDGYKEARVAVLHQAEVEKGVIELNIALKIK